ncbi:MAG: hypothetical protein ABI556_16290 [Gemmatimonadales bacterium]
MNFRPALFAIAVVLGACDAISGPGGKGGNVAIQFTTGSSVGTSSNVLVSENAQPAADELTLTGTNGTLVIQDIKVIVSELELGSSVDSSCESDEVGDKKGPSGEGDDDADGDNNDVDDDEVDDDADCKFEGGPFVVDLPLQGNTSITTENIPAGTYDSFKFKIDDLEIENDDDAAESQRVPAVLTELRTAYPNFPSRASMVVKGTQNGQPFVVYARAKIKVKQALSPPLVVPTDKVLTVQLDPSVWFKSGNQVMNLLALNGQLIGFDSQFKNGLKSVRRGKD